MDRDRRRFEPKLDEILLTGLKPAKIIKNGDAGEQFGGAYVDTDSLARSQRPFRIGQDFDFCIDHLGRLEYTFRCQYHSPLENRMIDAAKVDRNSIARCSLF